ncbi:hypothetical protein JW721_05600 [Candidatus Micrarchaeota archaeon]|nr:hypothetical protein [Candidatus Micrarchaeota archaeon]
MKNTSGLAPIIAAAALSVISCKAPMGSVSVHSMPALILRQKMEASLENECRGYCAYMKGDKASFLSYADPELLGILGHAYGPMKSAQYGPKIKGKVLFCYSVPEKMDVEGATAQVRFAIGLENKAGKRYVINRRVAFSFGYVPNADSNLESGHSRTTLFPVWSIPGNSRNGILSEELGRDLGKSRGRRNPKASGEGMQALPKKLIRKSIPAPRKHMVRSGELARVRG